MKFSKGSIILGNELVAGVLNDVFTVTFTSREEEILVLLSRDKDATDIARALGLHKDVVTKYITSIQEKLKLHSHNAVRDFSKVAKFVK